MTTDHLSRPIGVRVNRHAYLQTDGLPPAAIFDRIEAELGAGRRVLVAGEPFVVITARLGRPSLGQCWLALSRPSARGPAWLYRLRDAVAAAFALLLLSPLLALIALLVKLSSSGPVFYRAQVVGVQGRPFTWFKFRSMRPLPPEEDERRRREQFRAFAERSQSHGGADKDYKVIDPSRVTPVGRILRKYSLDELPQLINVLMGQMSLVGPRPCLPYEAALFPGWARRRFAVRPGLTGVWQVYGRGRVGLEEALAMDVYYLYTRSLWLDLKLILRTVAVVLNAQGAR